MLWPSITIEDHGRKKQARHKDADINQFLLVYFSIGMLEARKVMSNCLYMSQQGRLHLLLY
ncbi:hypothetical protein [Snodgrassella sp. CFCC 13594]|uniref:hypothetical protein n=1 Tax=Snodgrassella sp. CFCC 13594 TaxID=1775559 RepID=UPI00083706D3|nr:hypothetical protein [Snodgrassella sp. CFCC 13594]